MSIPAASTALLAPSPEASETKRRLPLVNQYLRSQQDLTAVERFSRRHDAEELPSHELYKELIPLTRPRSGEQYAFQVDLDACTGCKACVSACHHLNGLDELEAETWRAVGLLHGGTPAAPVQQTVTTACHHCLDPACMKGCPVNAYEKSPETGIVRHLDDQCIGCQYCTLTCPYEVPQFSKSRGIVRKCDMCGDRLAGGEAPACVQACPNEAISIRIVDVARALEEAQVDAFLPGAPSPGITVPTTSYVTERVFPRNMLPADFYTVRQGHQHFPLVIMLVLTQLSVGAFVVDFALERLSRGAWVTESRPYHALVGLAMGLLALGASTLHLGRPHLAFRAVVGLRTSWLSREILAFGAFAGSAMFYTLLCWYTSVDRQIGLPGVDAALRGQLVDGLGWAVASSGLLGILCSVMLYAVTGRRWWSAGRTVVRFGLTALVLGLATALVTSCAVAVALNRFQEFGSAGVKLCWALSAATLTKLLVDSSVMANLYDKQLTELKRTAMLLRGELKTVAGLRVAVASVCGILLPLVLAEQLRGASAIGGLATVVVLSAAFLGLLVGEMIERALFFKASSAPKMPGAF
ncbi:MAG TPA: DmsC/YnfH family molybdoenzyme membrane anchor subunit [Polyangiaceae bacterium]|nr:DmsC/YnfH family molybdoenzyme membrane anchor subunit [Polyangiaceae bacterium]